MIGSIVKPNAKGLRDWSSLRELPNHEAVVVKIGDGFSKDRLLVQFPFEHHALHRGSDRTGGRYVFFSPRLDCYWLYPNEVKVIKHPTPISYEDMM